MGEQAEQEGKGEAVERAKGFPQLFAEVEHMVPVFSKEDKG